MKVYRDVHEPYRDATAPEWSPGHALQVAAGLVVVVLLTCRVRNGCYLMIG